MWRVADELRQILARDREAQVERMLRCTTDWDQTAKFCKELGLRGATFKPLDWWPELREFNAASPTALEPDQYRDSPSGRWRYCRRTLPRGHVLSLYSGNRKGCCCFDSDVVLPALWQRRHYGGFGEAPLMSMTPMEMLSLLPGTRLAKGHTVVAGLGLGYQLIEVSKRRNVKKLTLIERDAELVEWLWPKIEPHLGQAVEIVIGDVEQVLLHMEADVALVDTFPSYGGNDLWRGNHAMALGVKRIWCWGGAQ